MNEITTERKKKKGKERKAGAQTIECRTNKKYKYLCVK